jgi:HD superfamily phosphodiesterase
MIFETISRLLEIQTQEQVNNYILALHFVNEKTKHFDSSHSIDHIYRVLNYLLDIVSESELYETLNLSILIYSVIFHDVNDHKYSNDIDIRSFLVDYLDTASVDKILYIIDNVSFSKQVKVELEQVKEPDVYLDIVRDADRLDALGKVGIQRCEEYTKSKMKQDQIRGLVVKHCYDKLLRLYPERFILTKKGRALAFPLHMEIVSYVLQNGTI